MRKTLIVATLGPASWKPKTIRALLFRGADAFRLNLSHATTEADYLFLAGVAKLARAIAKRERRKVYIMVDTPGHKFRLGVFLEREVAFGQILHLTCKKDRSIDEIPFPYKRYLDAMQPGQEGIVGDGIPRFKVIKKIANGVVCQVTLGGLLEPGKGLTVPGLNIGNLRLPHLTLRDKRGCKFAVDVGAEEIVLSYGTSAAQAQAMRQYIKDLGGNCKLIFKYELQEAGKELGSIVAVTDGGFVGQGDLGLSVGYEGVPFEGARVVSAYRKKSKSCVVCTQLLKNMETSPLPTYGEVAGIVFHVRQGVTALALSNETAMGKYPAEAVAALARIINAAEKDMLA